MRALRFALATPHVVLRYEKVAEGGLFGYSDSDFAGESDARSSGAYMF